MWSFAYGALPFIQKQEIKMKQYEILAESQGR
jgi:hypothetical protein